VHVDSDDVDGQRRHREVQRNLRRHRELTTAALHEFDRGRDEAAAVLAQTAACHGYFHHPGLWASPELEQMLATIGRRALPRLYDVAPPLGRRPTERVLHVLTRVASIGGHSRMVWRWIGQDSTRSHSVVLTRQGALPVPDDLEDAVRSRGGSVRTLNRTRGTVLSWAEDLRDHARDFDLVVLHIYAEDVIPLIAFADRTGLPPVAFVDQADHAFSIGPASSDLYIGLRDAGARLAVERRGVAAERVAELPITIAKIDRTKSRAEAKQLLGLSADNVVLLAVARAPKFRSHGGEHYSAPFRELVTRHPEVRLLVIGPEADETWRAITEETGGQIRAFGERPDTKTFYEAADIYVDSFPAISNTSLLEAGCHSIPLVSRCLQPGPHTVLCADAPGFASQIVRTSDRREHAEALERLVVDAVYREKLGEETKAAIEASHVGAGWQGALERIYEQTETIPRLTALPTGPDLPRSDALDLLWSEVFGSDISLADIRSWFVKGLPFGARLRAWLEITAQQRRVRPQLLVPEWATAHLRELRTRIRAR